MKLYMFRTAPLSIIRSFSLYTQQWYMSYRFAGSLGEQVVSKPVWHIPLLCVQWKTPDDGQRSCPKHVEFNSKNKFEKLVHLVGFIIRNVSQCTVTWTSKSLNLFVFGTTAPQRARASSFTRFLDHTRRTAVGRAPLD